MKHIEIKELMVQQWVKEKRVGIRKISSEENSSDVLTKYVDKATLVRHLVPLGLQDSPVKAPRGLARVELAQSVMTQVMALLALAGKAESRSTEVVEYFSPQSVVKYIGTAQNHPDELLWWVLMAVIAMILMNMFLCACVCAMCCLQFRTPRTSSSVSSAASRRSVTTQSQTTYTALRSVAVPRFLPLPEGGHGAWPMKLHLD